MTPPIMPDRWEQAQPVKRLGGEPPGDGDPDPDHPDPASIICAACGKPYGYMRRDPYTGRTVHEPSCQIVRYGPGALGAGDPRDAPLLGDDDALPAP